MKGDYLKDLKSLDNVVELLVYGVVKIEGSNDTTALGDNVILGSQ